MVSRGIGFITEGKSSLIVSSQAWRLLSYNYLVFLLFFFLPCSPLPWSERTKFKMSQTAGVKGGEREL